MKINLFEARKRSRYTRDEVAIQTGISYKTLQKMEKGIIDNYCIMDVAVLAKFYGVSLFEIDNIQNARYVRSRRTEKEKLTKHDYNTFVKKSRR